MEWGLLTLGDLLPPPGGGAPPTETARHRSIVEQAVLAEQVGFDVVHVGEHHGSDFHVSAPPVLLAAIGERTTRLRLSALLAGPAIVGSAHEVVDKVGRWADLFGLDRLIAMFDLGGLRMPTVVDAIERFGRSVLPPLRCGTGDGHVDADAMIATGRPTNGGASG